MNTVTRPTQLARPTLTAEGSTELLIRWAVRWLGIYLAVAFATMVLGTGVLYIAHLVQPQDRWPNRQEVQQAPDVRLPGKPGKAAAEPAPSSK